MSYATERREEEKERRREEILDAAEVVFSDKGFETATMDQVARKARVSRALVYVYFKDKEALLIGVCIRGLRILKQMFRQARLANPKGCDQVRAIGGAYMAFAEQYPTHFKVLSRLEAQGPMGPASESCQLCESQMDMMQAGQQVHEETVLAIVQGKSDGSIRPDISNPMQVSITLWAFSHGTIQLAQTKENFMTALGLDKKRFMNDALDLAMNSLVNHAQLERSA